MPGEREGKRIKEKGKRKEEKREGPKRKGEGPVREVEGPRKKKRRRGEGGCKVQGVGKQNCQGETLGFGG